MPDDLPDVPFRLRARAVVPAGWPPDVLPNQLITAAHINAIRSSVYAWPGDVDGQGHTLSNVHLAGATGVLSDPTTTAGDLIARGAAAIDRLPIGGAGQVLTVDLAAPAKLKWATPGVAPVLSVFGRLGAVVAQAGDYTAAQVTGAVVDNLTTKGDIFARGAAATGRFPAGADGQVLRADSAQPFGMRWSGESVPSVFGRTGPIAAQAGDYTAAQVTNAVSVLGTYPDPAWLPSLSWGKLIGAPASFPPAAHTHDAAAVVSGVIAPARLGTGVADATVYLRGDGTWAAAGTGGGGGVVSVFGRAGTVVAQTGDYTAAQVTGAVVNPTTIKGDLMVRNDLNSIVRLPVGASGQVLQADSSLTVGMKWTNLTAAVQTPWVTDIDAANFQLLNVRRIGVATALPAYPLDVTGDINFTGTLRQNGVAVSFGGSQTPWISHIAAAGFNLNSVGAIGIGQVASSSRLGINAGSLSTTVGAGIILQSALAFTPNTDELTTTLWRASAGTQWDSALWRLQRTVDGTDIDHMDFGPNRIAFAVGGVERCVIASAGIGIGMTPTAPIEISDIIASDSPGSAHKIRYSWGGTAVFAWRLAAGNAALALDALGNSWYPAISIHRQSNKVGINTAAPQGTLGVIPIITSPSSVATALQITVGETTNAAGYYMSLGYFVEAGGWRGSVQAMSGGAAAPLILNGLGGNVGIATSNPGYRLDVAGQINATGFLLNGSPHLATLAAGADDLPPDGGLNLWLDEASGRIAVRYRNRSGVLKTGYIPIE